jgi:hypothetical protein
MPVAMLMEIEGGTQAQYDAVMAELQLESMPEGGIAHISAPMDGGWRVLDVWQTREHFERFYAERLQRAIQNAGVPPAEPKFQELHNVMSIEHAPAQV